MLDCTILFLKITLSFIFNYLAANHHVDDELEAATYINQYVADSVCFIMEISPEEEEQTCTPLQGSSRLFEFRYTFPEFTVS